MASLMIRNLCLAYSFKTISIIRWQPEFLDSLSCLILPDFVNLVDSKCLLRVSQAELVFTKLKAKG